MSDTNGFGTMRARKNGVFERTAFGKYGVKTTIALGLPQSGLLALRTFKAQQVTMEGVYRHPHASTSVASPSLDSP